MKIFVLEYSDGTIGPWPNLGDDIQSIAAKRLLPRVDGGIFREALAAATEDGILSMNGYFLEGTSWPPAPTLVPFFHSFHIAPKSIPIICSREGIAYLKKYQPIGCRDRSTTELLLNHGVDAYYGKCISLTLPARATAPAEGKVFLVDVGRLAASVVPAHIRNDAIVASQAKIRMPGLVSADRERLAEHLLDTYAKHASLVITSRIHCAMPCLAMGIPVVFLHDKGNEVDGRVSIMRDLLEVHHVDDSWFDGGTVNPRLSGAINWSPAPVDLEQEKRTIREDYLRAFRKAVERFAARWRRFFHPRTRDDGRGTGLFIDMCLSDDTLAFQRASAAVIIGDRAARASRPHGRVAAGCALPALNVNGPLRQDRM